LKNSAANFASRREITRDEFAASYGLPPGGLAVRVERCGCVGNPFCRGWQLVAFGRAPLYPIPV
jgi:hypothetical protein